MNISLTPELDSYVQEKVQSGMYHSASEVIRAGLRLLKEQDDFRKYRLDQIRKEVDIGVTQIERGEYTEFDANSLPNLAEEIKAEGRKKLAQQRAGDS